jgi:hypothetical protein
MRKFYSFFCEEKTICLLFLEERRKEEKREFGKRKERK